MKKTKSHLLKRVLITLAAFLFCLLAGAGWARKPNVILVITDDQGYGDVASHGNEMIQTPHLDRLRGESVRLTDYHVDPTCSPTRSALMSGRYSTRTGVWHTIMGRSMMHTEEVTLAEVLRDGGYRTGMFGKWHLGDNHPNRPQDQGFQEVLMHGGGGVWQTPDFFGNDYFDDTYFRNGVPEKFQGYCTDVWFAEALKFIEANREKPFFCYLATNAPHGPFWVAEHYEKYYLDRGVPPRMAAFYGMITNMDENMGRLMKALRELGLEEDTILIFTTDNGTAAGSGRRRNEEGTWNGFNDGMRGAKGSEYDGGHRVPFFIRWPGGRISGGRDVDTLTAHVDILPTLAELCGVEAPAKHPRDGRSLAPLLKGGATDWPERTLFVHSQRIEYPEKWRKSSVMTERWRLINGRELYDIRKDPGQKKNVAEEFTSVVFELRQGYEKWWESLKPSFERDVPIGIGAPEENPARITCHDWHAPIREVPWNQDHIRNGLVGNGYWIIDVEKDGEYEFGLRRWDRPDDRWIEAMQARIKVGDQEAQSSIPAGASEATLRLKLKAGRTRLQTWLKHEPSGTERGAYYIYAKRLIPQGGTQSPK